MIAKKSSYKKKDVKQEEAHEESDSIEDMPKEIIINEKDDDSYYVKTLKKYETHLNSILQNTHIPMIGYLMVRIGLYEIYKNNYIEFDEVYNSARAWYDEAYKYQHTLISAYNDKMQSILNDISILEKNPDLEPYLIIEMSWLLVTFLRETPFARMESLLDFIRQTREKINLFY